VLGNERGETLMDDGASRASEDVPDEKYAQKGGSADDADESLMLSRAGSELSVRAKTTLRARQS
jgi:hypothetical protein